MGFGRDLRGRQLASGTPLLAEVLAGVMMQVPGAFAASMGRLVVLLGWFIGWSHLRRLWPRRGWCLGAVSEIQLRRAERVGWVPRTQASTTSAKRSHNYRND